MATRALRVFIQSALKHGALFLKDPVLLYALLTSLTGFALDTVLPVILDMADQLPRAYLSSEASVPLIMTIVILGMVFGEIIFGPMSDRYGRKPIILVGLMIFAGGTLLVIVAPSLEWALLGRALQGFGVSGPKIGTRAMIRDQYVGPNMARILSLIFSILIIVPMLAPFLGQWIGTQFGWRVVFWFLMALAIIAAFWLILRQAETWPQSARKPISWRQLCLNILAIISHRQVMCYTMVAGLIFGVQLFFLSVAAIIFEDIFVRSSQLPFWFALLGAAMACGSLANSHLVKTIEMAHLVQRAGQILFVIGGAMSLLLLFGKAPHFSIFFAAMVLIFLCIGMVFGNINAMAMQYLGQYAGLGASLIASLSSLIAFSVAAFFGLAQIETLQSLFLLVFLCSILILFLLKTARS